MQVTAIVPKLHPVIDGIGDYALKLAQLLREFASVETRFIVGDPNWGDPNWGDANWRGGKQVSGFPAQCVSARSSSALASLLQEESNTVLVHYEGYGYATRGCPFWLVDALEAWRNANDNRRLLTMLHELYAFGPPWTSAFWLTGFQRSLTTRIAKRSDQVLTSIESYAQKVAGMCRIEVEAIDNLPVFSSVGEPASVPPLGNRPRRMVVFGTPGRRIDVYRTSAAELNRICRALSIDEIVDIGRPIDFDIASSFDLPVSICWELTGEEASSKLLDATAGVIDYQAAMLGKSTIFAAYCSHGLLPIVANFGDDRSADGLNPGEHFWFTSVPSEALRIEAAQKIANNALSWYSGHNAAAHSARLATRITGTEQPRRTAESRLAMESCF